MSSPVAQSASLGSTDTKFLDQSLIKGMFWTGLVKWSSQIVSWVTTIFVARLLRPEDYGVVGMAGTFIGLVALLNEFGVGITIVSLRDLNQRVVAQLNSLSVVLGVAGFLLSCAAAVPLGVFYGTPEVAWVVVALAGGFLFTGFRTVPGALLQKELRFRVLALIDGLQVFIQAAFMVLMAALGFGYWTLVVGGLVGTLSGTIATLIVRTHSFAMPSTSSLKEAMTFSWHIVLARLSWCIQSNADSVITGKVLGQTALGFYGMALSLAMVPVEKIAAVVNQVTTSLFAAVQKDTAALREQIEALGTRINALESRLQQQHHDSARTSALWLSFRALEADILAGRPHGSALAAWLEAIDGRTGLKDASAPLKSRKDTGVPTLSNLQRRLSDAITSMARGTRRNAPSAWDSLWHNLRGLVVVRKHGAQHDGDDDGSIIARAEAALMQGEVAKAHSILQAISPDAARYFVLWQRDASVHLKARKSLAEASALLAANPTEAP